MTVEAGTKVLGDHVKQAGSHVAIDRLRFDFTHPEALTKQEIQQIENIANKEIANSMTVKTEVMNKKDASKKGAMALFGEKYGDKVRVVSMGEFSAELCGGTHVQDSSEIGLISIISESALASGVRRLEAITSTPAIERLNNRSKILEKLEIDMSAKDEKLLVQVEVLKNDLKAKKKDIDRLNDKIRSLQSGSIFENPEELKHGFLFKLAEAPEGSDLRKLSDLFINKNSKGILLLHSTIGAKRSVLLRTNQEHKFLKCSEIMKKSLPLINGRGGGRPDMAQGSGEKKIKLEEFLATIKKSINDALESI